MAFTLSSKPSTLEMPFNEKLLQERLGYDAAGIIKYLGPVSQREADEFWAHILSQKTPLIPHGLKLYALDVANLDVELHGFAATHQPDVYMFLADSVYHTPRYLYHFEGKQDVAANYLTNVRKVQQFIARHARIRRPQDQANAQPVLIFTKHADRLHYLEQMTAAGFDLMIDFHQGCTVAIAATKAALKYLKKDERAPIELPPEESVMLKIKGKRVPLKTWVSINPEVFQTKLAEFQGHAHEQLKSYQLDPNNPQRIINEFGYSYQFVKEQTKANGTTKYVIDEEAVREAAAIHTSITVATTISDCTYLEAFGSVLAPFAMAQLLREQEEEVAPNFKCHGYYDMPKQAARNLIQAQAFFSLISGTECVNPSFLTP